MDKFVDKKSEQLVEFLFANSGAIDDIRFWKFRGTLAYELFQTQKPPRALQLLRGRVIDPIVIPGS